MDNDLNNLKLIEDFGFINIASWEILNSKKIDYKLKSDNLKGYTSVNAALYAFVCHDEVFYVGKTSVSISKRFVGYCDPGKTQTTNRQCHNEIRHLLGLGKQVDIYVFVDEMQLQWSNISIDLAAGLETALINRMNPRLNGGKSGDKISETKEIEGDFIKNYHNYLPEFRSTNAAASDSRLNKFSIKLGKTYYTNGYLNPGIDISGSLGDDGEQISVQLGLDGDVISSKINRRANLNGSVRIVGNNVLIAEWFKKHFNENDSVEGCIINRNQIQLLAPSK